MNHVNMYNEAGRIELHVSSADEMYETMTRFHMTYPNAVFEDLEYIGVENGSLAIKLSYSVI